MIKEISSKLILVIQVFQSSEIILKEEKVIELDTIVILRGLNGKRIIGHVETGKLEDLFLIT
jgi:hypothetical protein